jgi:tetrathionate reductase subunit B
MAKILIIDITKCNGCHNCQIACKDEHVGNDWFPIARPQPLTGQFWTKVSDKVRGTIPKVKVSYLHSICRHCDNAPCITACPNKAIYKRPDGIVIIDPSKCKGDRSCLTACPYEDVIYFNKDLNISQKCTFCAHLIGKGWNETRCSDVCPTGAFAFGDEEELKDRIAEAEPMPHDLETKPRVYFIGIPKRFVGATIFDPDEDEVIIDACVSIIAQSSKEEIPAKTDEFGDFWVDGLSPERYDVVIKKSGYPETRLDADLTDGDINLGDIPMRREAR